MITAKKSTATNAAATNKIAVVTSVLQKCNMSYEDWVLTFFNQGCAFVEKKITHPTLQKKLLQQDFFGYWDWFMLLWINDDELLLKKNITGLYDYTKEKRWLLATYEGDKQFEFFLKSNTKLQNFESI